jgi:TRAP-type uncharacterized transport system fused permease subunit
VVALAAATAGFHHRALPAWERLALAAAAVALLAPGMIGDLAGGATLAISMLRRA